MRCARHHQETAVSCGRCDAAVCPRCMVYTDVGIRCRDCSPRQRGRPVWGGNSVLVGVVVLFLVVLAIGSFGAVGLGTSGRGGQVFQDFPDDLADLEPEVAVQQVVDPWTPEAGVDGPAEGRRFVAIEVTITGRSSGVGQFASPSAFKLTDSAHFAYSGLTESPKTPALRDVGLAAGERASG